MKRRTATAARTSRASRPKAIPPALIKADPRSPVFKVTGAASLSIKAGTTFRGRVFSRTTPVLLEGALEAGADYVVTVAPKLIQCIRATELPVGDQVLGGFHFAPGGNAAARAGGDSVPQINPLSLWDINFRPSCPDPRGMTLVTMPDGSKFWADIYLLGVDHMKDGTSRYGVQIADGNDPPQNPAGGMFPKLDFATADAVYKHHGKGLMSFDEFRAFAHGVTEKIAISRDPRTTGLDAPRTSQVGGMQATGNLWVWGHDGDPDTPRASIFGGGWFSGDHAGSRHANLAYLWPGRSDDSIGARGRGDHLTPA